jgi:hypothetical protein
MSRNSFLLVSQINTLNTWGKELTNMLPATVDHYGVYIVGSALKKADYRDIDIRQIISDKDFARLLKTVDIGYFNHAVSLWGQQLTGMPIDYQIQSIADKDNDGEKHPIHALKGYVNGERRKEMA